jgi:antitoxin CptB
MTESDDQARLKWQCRRGMRELDILLSTYLEHVYPQSREDRKQAFRELLQLGDPELIGYFLGDQLPPDPALASIVSEIRNRSYA